MTESRGGSKHSRLGKALARCSNDPFETEAISALTNGRDEILLPETDMAVNVRFRLFQGRMASLLVPAGTNLPPGPSFWALLRYMASCASFHFASKYLAGGGIPGAIVLRTGRSLQGLIHGSSLLSPLPDLLSISFQRARFRHRPGRMQLMRQHISRTTAGRRRAVMLEL